mmetsp:Transcript_5669/g.21978  ORF Transcript_5669/g.21978 Transcript_5669/m.21978 type:complete len:267 (+) Transcript_5669:2844-3644(+)
MAEQAERDEVELPDPVHLLPRLVVVQPEHAHVWSVLRQEAGDDVHVAVDLVRDAEAAHEAEAVFVQLCREARGLPDLLKVAMPECSSSAEVMLRRDDLRHHVDEPLGVDDDNVVDSLVMEVENDAEVVEELSSDEESVVGMNMALGGQVLIVSPLQDGWQAFLVLGQLHLLHLLLEEHVGLGQDLSHVLLLHRLLQDTLLELLHSHAVQRAHCSDELDARKPARELVGNVLQLRLQHRLLLVLLVVRVRAHQHDRALGPTANLDGL